MSQELEKINQGDEGETRCTEERAGRHTELGGRQVGVTETENQAAYTV